MSNVSDAENHIKELTACKSSGFESTFLGGEVHVDLMTMSKAERQQIYQDMTAKGSQYNNYDGNYLLWGGGGYIVDDHTISFGANGVGTEYFGPAFKLSANGDFDQTQILTNAF